MSATIGGDWAVALDPIFEIVSREIVAGLAKPKVLIRWIKTRRRLRGCALRYLPKVWDKIRVIPHPALARALYFLQLKNK